MQLVSAHAPLTGGVRHCVGGFPSKERGKWLGGGWCQAATPDFTDPWRDGELPDERMKVCGSLLQGGAVVSDDFEVGK